VFLSDNKKEIKSGKIEGYRAMLELKQGGEVK